MNKEQREQAEFDQQIADGYYFCKKAGCIKTATHSIKVLGFRPNPLCKEHFEETKEHLELKENP